MLSGNPFICIIPAGYERPEPVKHFEEDSILFLYFSNIYILFSMTFPVFKQELSKNITKMYRKYYLYI